MKISKKSWHYKAYTSNKMREWDIEHGFVNLCQYVRSVVFRIICFVGLFFLWGLRPHTPLGDKVVPQTPRNNVNRENSFPIFSWI